MATYNHRTLSGESLARYHRSSAANTIVTPTAHHGRSSASYWARPIAGSSFSRAQGAGVRTMKGRALQGKGYWRKLYIDGQISLRTAHARYAEECRAAAAYLNQERRQNALVPGAANWNRRFSDGSRAEWLGRNLAHSAWRGTRLALRLAAAYIRRAAANEIKVDAKPSFPGRPPHTRRGALKAAIRYAEDTKSMLFVVGPTALEMGDVSFVHEFGGERLGRQYPKRPFMGPVVARCAPYVAARFNAVMVGA